MFFSSSVTQRSRVQVYDPRQKLVAVVNAKTCAMTDLGSPRGDDDLQVKIEESTFVIGY